MDHIHWPALFVMGYAYNQDDPFKHPDVNGSNFNVNIHKLHYLLSVTCPGTSFETGPGSIIIGTILSVDITEFVHFWQCLTWCSVFTYCCSWSLFGCLAHRILNLVN